MRTTKVLIFEKFSEKLKIIIKLCCLLSVQSTYIYFSFSNINKYSSKMKYGKL